MPPVAQEQNLLTAGWRCTDRRLKECETHGRPDKKVGRKLVLYMNDVLKKILILCRIGSQMEAVVILSNTAQGSNNIIDF